MATAKNTAAKTKPAAKKAAPAKAIKQANAETLKLVDQQKEMMAKSTGKLVMPKIKPVTEPAVQSKADIARAIFKRMKGKPRKDVIAAFQAEANLTPAGSATYYANFKREQQ